METMAGKIGLEGLAAGVSPSIAWMTALRGTMIVMDRAVLCVKGGENVIVNCWIVCLNFHLIPVTGLGLPPTILFGPIYTGLALKLGSHYG
jgi:hypothetical protein